ncbi:PD40 domain-containing protein [Nocardioides nitrophenolicus]|uniref:PD40 domain-containing protein n=1 Tax=Nocardioides nitrophenolicus TaxID=60489 RepID=UPI0019581798|nr:PD40 domain-containing protein [Nocardioides nitrophenolicus]MBM7517839.1 Tol biopolymer transport system component [Nocardioides nitrophenolicus]
MVPRRHLPLVVALVVTLALVLGPAPSSTAVARPTVRVALSATDVAAGTTVVATVRVRGGAARQRVSLQRRTGAVWTKVATRRLPRTGAVRKVRFAVSVAPGVATYRVVLARRGGTPGRRGAAFTLTGRTPGGAPSVPEPLATRLVSHRPGGATAGDQASTDASISADGRFVVFESTATDLLPGGSGGLWQVYLWDRTTDALTLVSHRADGTPGLASSRDPAISGDGRYVTFQSGANQLGGVSGVGPDSLWRWDRTTDLLQRLTPDSLDDGVTDPVISADGSAIAFASTATTIAGPGAPAASDIFLWRQGSGFTLVSHGATAANGASRFPAISADGLHVAYESKASNLVGMPGGQEDANGKSDVFLWDATMIATTEPVLVSTAHGGLTAGTGGTEGAFWPTLSADGSLVAYETDATNVLATPDGDTNKDVFLWSRDAPGSQVLVSRPTGTGPGSSSAYNPSMSTDGSRIAFLGRPDDLTGAGTFIGSPMLWTRATGQFTDLAPALAGAPTGAALSVTLSGSGSHAAFSSYAANLVGGATDANGTEDVFVRGPLS